MNSLSDRELVFEMQKGNLEALGDLYDRYRILVFRTAIAITGDYEFASDLLQDVFLRLFQFSNKIDLDRPIQPWLYRMTTNLAYTQIKREKNCLNSLTNLVDWFSGTTKNQPAETVEMVDDWDHLQLAITNLPFPQRVVVVLYYLNDLSLTEIAEILEIPIGTVKSRLHYGRNALKKSLRGTGISASDRNYLDLPV
jgi:RNA polymerase sigma-70 factor (ECF subfamily)